MNIGKERSQDKGLAIMLLLGIVGLLVLWIGLGLEFTGWVFAVFFLLLHAPMLVIMLRQDAREQRVTAQYRAMLDKQLAQALEEEGHDKGWLQEEATRRFLAQTASEEG